MSEMPRSGGCVRKQYRTKGSWQPVVCEFQYVIRGGASRAPHALVTTVVADPSGDKRFCRVSKSETWLIKCVAGPQGKRNDLKRCKALEELKKKLTEGEASAVADDSQATTAAADEGDIMDGLDAVDAAEVTVICKKRKYQLKRARDKVMCVSMPDHPLSSNSAVAASMRIELLSTSTNVMMMNVDYIPWLINYMGEELCLGGVPPLAEPAAVAAGNCEIPNLRIDYDFGDDIFYAEFVDGPAQGESVTSHVAAMTEAKWHAIVPAREVEFGQATFAELKDGLELYVKAHCAAVLHRYELSLVEGGSAVAES